MEIRKVYFGKTEQGVLLIMYVIYLLNILISWLSRLKHEIIIYKFMNIEYKYLPDGMYCMKFHAKLPTDM